MISKSALLKRSQLCVIIDREILTKGEAARAAKAAISGGASMIQLRDKASAVSEMSATAKALKGLTARYKVPLIINDRPEVALAVNADGLHVGQGDIDVRLARRLIGKDNLLGVSVTNYKEALSAKRNGADYLGVGPVFRTPIKGRDRPVGLRLLNKVKHMGLPVFAIGGIDCKNVAKLAKAGFRKIAVIRAVCGAKDAFKATRRLKKALE